MGRICALSSLKPHARVGHARQKRRMNVGMAPSCSDRLAMPRNARIFEAVYELEKLSHRQVTYAAHSSTHTHSVHSAHTSQREEWHPVAVYSVQRVAPSCTVYRESGTAVRALSRPVRMQVQQAHKRRRRRALPREDDKAHPPPRVAAGRSTAAIGAWRGAAVYHSLPRTHHVGRRDG